MRAWASFIAASACAAFLGAMATGAAARDLPISAFVGTFVGGGVAENEDSIYFAVTARDFDVKIRALGEGFAITWTSVIRRGGDPDRPRIRRKSTSMVFVPSGRAGLYRATASGDPLAGGEMSWARIRGNTLTVYLMIVEADGSYQIQRYDRTLSPEGMQLVFTRIKDGERVRTVKGRLVKTAR